MIELDRIGKRFGTVDAVQSVSLTVKQGELLSLLGPSGCGKTTTLRIIAGFEQPSSGRLRIGGRDMAGVPVEQRGLSMVFQNYALFPHLTAAENVAFGLRLRRVGREDREARVRRALEQVGLAGMGSRSPRQLSGGQQQRVSLARALVLDPSVLLMDEPLSNLDLKLREQMRDEIRALQRASGITAVCVTHDQGEAMAMSDRVAVMRSGRLDQVGTPREIYEQPASVFVAGFIGQCNLLRGTWAPGGGPFRTAGGLVLQATAGRACLPGIAVLAIRPEALKVVAPDHTADAPNRFQGVVQDVAYLGEAALLTARAEGETVRLIRPVARGAALPGIGDRIALSVDPADCLALAGDG